MRAHPKSPFQRGPQSSILFIIRQSDKIQLFAMERHNRRSMMGLSITQIAMSVIFFILGMVDGFKIRYSNVSLVYTPCWIAALVLPIGVMGLVLAYSRRPSSYLINAIWSVSVACIMFLAITIFRYKEWGMELLLFRKHVEADSFEKGLSGFDFLKKDAMLEFTDQEKTALAVFGVIIILSILEIVLTAAIAKISGASDQMPQPLPMYHMYYQPGQDVPQLRRTNASVPEVHNFTTDNHLLASSN